MKKVFFMLGLGLLLLSVNPSWADEDEGMKPVPKEYANKHMPKGWWTDPKIIEEGKKLFETAKNEFEFKRKPVKVEKGCSECHEIDKSKDTPKQRGARDFRVGKKMNMFSDSYWFWRISEGVPKTKMPAWKGKLSEDDIWKVVAYEHTWSHDMKPADHAHKEIVISVEK